MNKSFTNPVGSPDQLVPLEEWVPAPRALICAKLAFEVLGRVLLGKTRLALDLTHFHGVSFYHDNSHNSTVLADVGTSN